MKKLIFIGLGIFILFSACSKKGGISPDSDDNGNGGHLSGFLLFTGIGTKKGIQKIDLKTGRKTTVTSYESNLHGWDVSRDGKKILQSKDDPDQYNTDLYTYFQWKDDKIISQFSFSAPSRISVTHGYISFDEKMIAIPPDIDYGILIIDREGNLLYHLTGYNGHNFDNTNEVVWMPDNSLLFTLGESIYRSNTSFTKAKLIKTLNFKEWGDICVSSDGKKIAFYGGNHIWMMNSDGSNMTQVTTSNYKERHPSFSPDGHYIVLGSQWGGVRGGWGYATIVPADGKTYNVSSDKASKETIFIKNPERKDKAQQAFDGPIRWR